MIKEYKQFKALRADSVEVEVYGFELNQHFAFTSSVLAPSYGLANLTHIPTGCKVCTVVDARRAKRIAEALSALKFFNWSTKSRAELARAYQLLSAEEARILRKALRGVACQS